MSHRISCAARAACAALALVAAPPVLAAQLPGATTDSMASVRRFAGCYRLTRGAWSGALPPTGLRGAHEPPARFVLDSVRLSAPFDARFGARFGARYAVRPRALWSGARMPASWQPLGGDTATIVWSTGHVGVRLLVGREGDRLVGIARTFHDAHVHGEPPDPTAAVVAVRISCGDSVQGASEAVRRAQASGASPARDDACRCASPCARPCASAACSSSGLGGFSTKTTSVGSARSSAKVSAE